MGRHRCRGGRRHLDARTQLLMGRLPNAPIINPNQRPPGPRDLGGRFL